MTLTTAPTPEATAAPGWTRQRTLILLGGMVILFIGTYMLAWFSAYQLSLTFLRDADRSYDEGGYVNALVGYQAFDRDANRYIDYGGYMQVEHIWADAYALPIPPEVARARERIDEIINERLTTDEAEQYVMENVGRSSNPYLAIIYLRLGELYEADGRTRDAEDVYRSFADLFPDDTALIERAAAHLARLQASGN